MSTLVEQLRDLLGAEFVWHDPRRCEAFSVHGQVPLVVVAPGSAAELSQVLHIAQPFQAALVPWGGGTQQLIGGPLQIGQRPLVVLQTIRMNRVLEYEPADLTISVEAGMTLGALRRTLAEHGQMLPLDPAWPDQATIGGLIATAADGPRRLGYGTLRDLLIGIGVADAAGRLTKAGGMVVKNVSGFDMMKLYLGSFGSLAIITSANFKLLPIPRAAASLICGFDGLAPAFAFLDALSETQLVPTAAEYLNPAAGAIAGLAHGHHAVVLRTEGLPEAVARHLADLGTLARQHGCQHVQPVSDDLMLWEQIAILSSTKSLAATEAVLKLSCLPGDLEAQISRVEQLATRHQLELVLSARAMIGVSYLRIGQATPAALQALSEQLPLQWCATPLAQAPRWGVPPGLALMRQMKQEFDPQFVLNPGRFVAG